VIGVSLLGPCRLRFRRDTSDERESATATLDGRSAYVLTGAARWHWQHSIPPARHWRYSVTFRTLCADGGTRRR
jgi:alkylated DNA repair dioxygenase AlkB